MYGSILSELCVRAALEATADCDESSYRKLSDFPCLLSPCDAGNIVAAAVSTIDCQHKVTYFSAQRGSAQGRGFADGASEQNVVVILAILLDDVTGKDADNKACSVGCFIIK